MDRFSSFFFAVVTFYRGFCIPSGVITLGACIAVGAAGIVQVREQREFYGILAYVPAFFWIKTITSIIFLLYLVRFRPGERYFYYNLGISMTTLRIATFGLDYLIFFTGMYITSVIVNLLIPSLK